MRAALRLLADYPAGCPAGLILLRGFCAVDMIVLINEGLARPNYRRASGNVRTFDLSTVTLTAAGREAPAKAM